MDADFWVARWAEGKIGFHEGHPNPFLVSQIARLGARRRVLVPLCGKSEDLAFLAGQGHAVVGIELVEDAVRAFFDEHAITPQVERRDAHAVYSAGAIVIIAGDFFTTPAELLGPVDAVFDRAALVALPREMRVGYAQRIRTLIPAGSPGLVITLEYPQEQLEGPPFSVREDELRSLYPESSLVLLDEGPTENARIRDLGIDARDRCFAMTR